MTKFTSGIFVTIAAVAVYNGCYITAAFSAVMALFTALVYKGEGVE